MTDAIVLPWWQYNTAATRILLQAAVAALLTSASPGVNYPLTTAEVIAQVNAALASNDRSTMLALASQLDVRSIRITSDDLLMAI